jgi:hypothetical protein
VVQAEREICVEHQINEEFILLGELHMEHFGHQNWWNWKLYQGMIIKRFSDLRKKSYKNQGTIEGL